MNQSQLDAAYVRISQLRDVQHAVGLAPDLTRPDVAEAHERLCTFHTAYRVRLFVAHLLADHMPVIDAIPMPTPERAAFGPILRALTAVLVDLERGIEADESLFLQSLVDVHVARMSPHVPAC